MLQRGEYPAIGSDPQRIIDLVVQERWAKQDGLWQPYIRQVQDNHRMLEGRHWHIYEETTGRYIDISEELTAEERRWMQRPTFNWIAYWHLTTVAKLTENPPVFSFLPATADESDSELAMLYDAIYKHVWRESDMSYHVRQLIGMGAMAGAAVIKGVWNPDLGKVTEFRGRAPYEILDQAGQPEPGPDGAPLMMVAEDAPFQFDAEGKPIPMIQPQPGGSYSEIGPPAMMREGQIEVSTMSPLTVRTALARLPFHRQPWFVEMMKLTPEQVYDRYGVDLPPGSDSSIGVDIDEAMQRGSGFSGPMQSFFRTRDTSDLITCWEMWEMPRSEIPAGRHTVVTADHMLVDEQNPVSPIFQPYQRPDFIEVPGRVIGKSPIEDISPLNRAYNRRWGQILEWGNRAANPIIVVNAAAGVPPLTNAPGQRIDVTRQAGDPPPVEPVQMPDMPAGVYETASGLKDEMQDMGSLREGSEGRSANRSASGELMKELRANDDRYLRTPTENIMSALARLAEQFQPILRAAWPEERIITVVGDDQAATFHKVQRSMFAGTVHVVPNVESMLPEGRSERQQRWDWLLLNEAIDLQTYLAGANFPHLNKASAPGGVDKEMAAFENKHLMAGQAMPVLPFHDHAVHIDIHLRIMSSPKFLELDEIAQQVFLMHWTEHQTLLAEQLAAEMAMAGAAEGAGDEGEESGNGGSSGPGGGSGSDG